MECARVGLLLGELFLSVTAAKVECRLSTTVAAGFNLSQANCFAALTIKIQHPTLLLTPSALALATTMSSPTIFIGVPESLLTIMHLI